MSVDVGREDADPAASNETVMRSFGGRLRLLERLSRRQHIETWRGVDREGREVLIKSLPVDAISIAARTWIAVQTQILNESSGRLEAGGGRLDCGVEGDSFFVARPFVRGPTLKQRLADSPLAVRDAIALAIPLLATLEEVHAHGVVHGGIKPSNIVLVDQPLSAPVLVDFGLALDRLPAGALDEVQLDRLPYLAPEQTGLLERGVDQRTDLHALGLVMFESIAGRPPVGGRSVAEFLHRQRTAAPPPLGDLVPAVPRQLDRILVRLLAQDPRDRYQTARGVRADLEDLAAALDRGELEPHLVVGTRDACDAMTEPAFIGRAEEMAALERALGGAREGNGGLTLLEGVSGAGKTWLLEEFARRAGNETTWVLRGHADGHVAHHPFHVLSGLARQIATTAAGSARAERLVKGTARVGRALAELLPELRALFGVSTASTATASASPEPKDEDRSLAMLSVLIDALGSRDETALLLLDDGQWADELTLRLLARWQARPAGDGGESGGAGRRFVLVVLALRSDELGEDHPMKGAGPLARIRLSGFRSEELREQVTSMAGELPDRAVDLVVGHAAGNPFLASATLQGLVESGALVSTPRGWRLTEDRTTELRLSGRPADVLAARIDRLPPSAGRLLAVGALLGRTFDAVLAAQLGGIEPGEAMRVLLQLRRRLIWLDEDGARCRFLHERIREALLAQVPQAENRRLHRAAAELIEASDGDSEFELAHHYDAAGEPGRALPHAIQAAELAQAQHDMALAERCYRIAAQGLAEDSPRSIRFRVTRGLGGALLVRSAYDECRQLLDEADRLAPGAAARADVEERRTQLALQLGDFKRAAERGERALRLVGRFVPRRAVVCAAIVLWQLLIQFLHTRFRRLFVGRRAPDRAGADRFAIRVYHSLTTSYFSARGGVWALWAHLRELNLNERYPPSNLLGRTYGMHGAICSTFPRFFERAVRTTRVGAELCREQGDVWGEAHARQFLALGLCGSGLYREAVQAADESARLFEHVGDLWESDGPLGWGALARFRQGDLAGALQASQRLFERARALGDAHGVAVAVDTWARVTGGKLPAEILHETLHGELARRAEPVQTAALVAQAEALCLLGAGEADAAGRIIESWLRRLRKEGGMLEEQTVSLVVYRVTALRHQALQAPLTNPGRRAHILARARRASRRALAQARKFRNCEPHACREAALVAAMSGAPRRAFALIQRSIRAAERLGARFELALSREARGELGLALGRTGAIEELESARRELNAIGAALAAGDLERRVDQPAAAPARAGAELARAMQQLESTQQQLLHAGRMAAIGTLIAGLSHELNNPLTVILGNVENLIRLLPPADDDQRRRLADAIERQARRAVRLVRVLLGFSRTEPEKRQVVNPAELVVAVAELVGTEARRREIELRISIPEELPAVLVSPPHIESALVNIATNALQATPQRGLVEISVAVQSRADAPGVAFAVRDSGVGISPEVLPQIFDPFFTTKPAGQGTGLGLSLARDAVNAQGGTLDVESAPGAGTTMRLWLPASSDRTVT